MDQVDPQHAVALKPSPGFVGLAVTWRSSTGSCREHQSASSVKPGQDWNTDVHAFLSRIGGLVVSHGTDMTRAGGAGCAIPAAQQVELHDKEEHPKTKALDTLRIAVAIIRVLQDVERSSRCVPRVQEQLGQW